MIISSRKERHDYVLRDERELENPTVFEVASLTMQQRTRLLDMIGSSSGRIGTLVAEVIRTGIVGWRNLRDEDGGEVPPTFARNGRQQVLTDDALSVIAPVHTELYEAVLRLNELIPDEEGKSVSSRPWPEDGPSNAAN